jgi:hypothetical protein
VKHFKDGNTDIADQPRCDRQRTAATERNKQKSRRAHQRIPKDNSQRNCSTAWNRHRAVQDMMEILGYRRVPVGLFPVCLRLQRNTDRLGTALPSILQVRIWPPQTTTCSGSWKITWEVTTTRLTRQSRKPCEAGCEDLERTYSTEEFLRLYNAGRSV